MECRAKQKGWTKSSPWIYGYYVEKDEKPFIFNNGSLKEIDKDTLGMKTGRHFEKDVFDMGGYNFELLFIEEMGAFHLVRDVDFLYFLPISRMDDGIFLGNTIDEPSLMDKK